jgi:hypothetical protein
VPAWQPFAPVHADPCAQASQVPPLQTPPGQALPFGLSASPEQTGAPVAHEILPVWQPSSELQLRSAVHAAQVPALRRCFDGRASEQIPGRADSR